MTDTEEKQSFFSWPRRKFWNLLLFIFFLFPILGSIFVAIVGLPVAFLADTLHKLANINIFTKQETYNVCVVLLAHLASYFVCRYAWRRLYPRSN